MSDIVVFSTGMSQTFTLRGRTFDIQGGVFSCDRFHAKAHKKFFLHG